MRRFLFMSLDAAIAGLVMAPIFWILDKKVFHNRTKTFFYFLFAVYLSGMFAVVGLPDIRYIRFDPHFNFIPFAYMFSDFTSSFLNIVLFVPMGIFLPLLWNNFRALWKTLLFGFSASFLIELLQIFTFRASDINDLMTNTVGTIVGWSVARILLHFKKSITSESNSADIYWVFGITLFVMYFVHPYIADVIFSLFS